MNRLLLIPCVASCLGFVFLASSGRVDDATANYQTVRNAIGAATTDVEAKSLLTSQEVQDGLITRWSLYNTQKHTFSRVYRPEEHYRTPSMLVDESLPAPEGTFLGIFTLEESRPKLELSLQSENAPREVASITGYPIVADRRTGDAMVFASGAWTEFNHWAVTGK